MCSSSSISTPSQSKVSTSLLSSFGLRARLPADALAKARTAGQRGIEILLFCLARFEQYYSKMQKLFSRR